MKFTLILDTDKDEEVIVYAHERSPITDGVERLVSADSNELIGYLDKDIVKLSYQDIFCFTVESGKVFAITEDKKYRMSERLYALEERLDKGFIKINQSCIANISKIERFRASVSGALMVIFKNGHTDYVSRRQVREVKERIGFKL